MKSRRRICIALGASLTLGLTGVAVAATVTPPAGTPNLAAMVLQPGDLAAGAVAGTQRYVTPLSGFTAQYDGIFTTAATPDGVGYYLVSDGVSLAPDASVVSTLFGAEKAFFNSKKGHKLVDKGIIQDAGKKAHLKASSIKFKDRGSIGVGGGSFLLAIGISSKHTSIHEDLVLFEQGTVYVELVLTGKPGKSIPGSDAVLLATAIDSHVNSVLASTGTTGLTGATQ
jgi:hypothetical protein